MIQWVFETRATSIAAKFGWLSISQPQGYVHTPHLLMAGTTNSHREEYALLLMAGPRNSHLEESLCRPSRVVHTPLNDQHNNWSLGGGVHTPLDDQHKDRSLGGGFHTPLNANTGRRREEYMHLNSHSVPSIEGSVYVLLPMTGPWASHQEECVLLSVTSRCAGH